MEMGNLYRPKQALYQMKPGSDFGESNKFVDVKMDGYVMKKKGRTPEKKHADGAMAARPRKNHAHRRV